MDEPAEKGSKPEFARGPRELELPEVRFRLLFGRFANPFFFKLVTDFGGASNENKNGKVCVETTGKSVCVL